MTKVFSGIEKAFFYTQNLQAQIALFGSATVRVYIYTILFGFSTVRIYTDIDPFRF